MATKETKMASQEHKMTPKETKMASQGPATTTMPTSLVLPHKYSNRVLLKSVLERRDGGKGLVGKRLVVGGWVKSFKETRREAAPLPHPQAKDKPRGGSPGPKGVNRVEIPRSRIPFLRSIIKILCVGSGNRADNYPVDEKVETVIERPPPPSIAYLLVSDGSCAESLQVVLDSSLASPSRLIHAGTCILAEGVLKQATVMGKHSIELKADKILHIGAVDDAKYPLSKKRVPLETLRDCPHFRPRTTTVASVMRIRSALAFATETFFQNNDFLSVQVPIITTTDCEGFSEKFHVATLFSKVSKTEESDPAKDPKSLDLEVVKGAVKEKSNLVERLKRTESDREALAAAIQDLHKTNLLASQLEAKAKAKSGFTVKADKTTLSEDFFSRQTYLTTSGLFHLESYACALGNVYTFGPRFRADRKESPKHVAEMWMLEIQMAFSQLEDAMNSAEDYLKFLCKWVLDNCSGDMKFIAKRIDKTSIDRLQSLVACAIEKISYREAVDILKTVTDKVFETKLEWGIALTAEHLRYLADEMYKRPVIVYNHPKEVKPFYIRLNDDGNTVAAFDMVIPKVGTLISGSQSEERIDMLIARIKEVGLSGEQYEWYLDLRRHGTVKHSGFSLSFDLMVLFTTGLTDVRDAIPFPRSFGKAIN